MSEDDFSTEFKEALHPMNWVAYTLDCVPVDDITPEEAAVWAEEIKKTHKMIGSVATNEPWPIGHMLDLAESQSKQLVRGGQLIPGPLVLEGHIKQNGIGLWKKKSD